MNTRSKSHVDSRLPKVLDQAAKLFRTQGFEGTSVRDIARAVGMLPGSLYCHFATKEELLGDYHFERHDYSRAIKHYRQVLKELPDSPKIRRKIISSEYNIGMRHIKSHQYEQALKCMEWVLNADPNHEQARHKAKKLKAHLARGSAAIMSDHGE